MSLFFCGGSLFFHTTLSKNYLDYPRLPVVATHSKLGSLKSRLGRRFCRSVQSKAVDYPTTLLQGALCQEVVYFLDHQYRSILNDQYY